MTSTGLTLVLGGTRSGKSEVAERLAAGAGAPVTYVATWRPSPGAPDADMAARVAAHVARRPPHWATVEAGADLRAAVAGLTGTVLVDSLGTFVAGHPAMAAGVEGAGGFPGPAATPAGGVAVAGPPGDPGTPGRPAASATGLPRDLAALGPALAARAGATVVVSEEVGLGVHAPTPAGRRFADLLGLVNRSVADAADRVLLVVAGRVLPLERVP